MKLPDHHEAKPDEDDLEFKFNQIFLFLKKKKIFNYNYLNKKLFHTTFMYTPTFQRPALARHRQYHESTST